MVREADDDDVETEDEELGIGKMVGPDKDNTVIVGVYRVLGLLDAPKFEVRI